jgi:hypothetical protein
MEKGYNYIHWKGYHAENDTWEQKENLSEITLPKGMGTPESNKTKEHATATKHWKILTLDHEQTEVLRKWRLCKLIGDYHRKSRTELVSRITRDV